jgi:hypothetical protein
VSPQLKKFLPEGSEANEKVGTVSPQFKISRDKLIQRLSYSHLELIVDLEDDLKRTFYEIECIRGNWSVAGMDNGLFVSKYQLELPKKEEMRRFIEEQVREADS